MARIESGAVRYAPILRELHMRQREADAQVSVFELVFLQFSTA
jgi:hypothetical protein